MNYGRIILYFYVLLYFFVIFSFTFLVSIKENERGIKFRNGEFHSIMYPGFRFLIPIINSYKKVDISTRTVELSDLDFITKDDILVKVNFDLTYNIFDPKKALLDVENFNFAVIELVKVTMRNSILYMRYNDLKYRRESFGNSVLEVVRSDAKAWGLKVEKIEIKDIFPKTKV